MLPEDVDLTQGKNWNYTRNDGAANDPHQVSELYYDE